MSTASTSFRARATRARRTARAQGASRSYHFPCHQAVPSVAGLTEGDDDGACERPSSLVRRGGVVSHLSWRCRRCVAIGMTVVALTGCVGEGRTDRTTEFTDATIDDVDVTVEPSTAAPTVTSGEHEVTPPRQSSRAACSQTSAATTRAARSRLGGAGRLSSPRRMVRRGWIRSSR